MTHGEKVLAVAMAIQEEYRHLDGGPSWDHLHDDAKADWCHLARTAMNKLSEMIHGENLL